MAIGGDRRGIDVPQFTEPNCARLVLSGRAVHTRHNILVVLQEIESVVVQQHRGNIGRASYASPHHVLGIGEIALGALEVDGHQDLLFVATANVQHVVPVDRCCYNVGRHARALPQYVARFQVVSINAIGTAYDDLRLVYSWLSLRTMTIGELQDVSS